MLQPRRRGNRSTPACLMVREMLFRAVEAGEQVVSYGLLWTMGPRRALRRAVHRADDREARCGARERSARMRDSSANSTNVTRTLGPGSDAQKVQNRYPWSNKLLKAPKCNAVTTERVILGRRAAQDL